MPPKNALHTCAGHTFEGCTHWSSQCGDLTVIHRWKGPAMRGIVCTENQGSRLLPINIWRSFNLRGWLGHPSHKNDVLFFQRSPSFDSRGSQPRLNTVWTNWPLTGTIKHNYKKKVISNKHLDVQVSYLICFKGSKKDSIDSAFPIGKKIFSKSGFRFSGISSPPYLTWAQQKSWTQLSTRNRHAAVAPGSSAFQPSLTLGPVDL